MASISPTTTVIEGSTLHSSGSRPIVSIRARMSLRQASASALVAGMANSISSQRAARARPRGEEPACLIAGRTCGVRGIDSRPRTLTCLPLSWA